MSFCVLLLVHSYSLNTCPLQEQPDYRLAVIFFLSHLTVMDERPVTVEEKVLVVNSFSSHNKNILCFVCEVIKLVK